MPGTPRTPKKVPPQGNLRRTGNDRRQGQLGELWKWKDEKGQKTRYVAKVPEEHLGRMKLSGKETWLHPDGTIRFVDRRTTDRRIKGLKSISAGFPVAYKGKTYHIIEEAGRREIWLRLLSHRWGKIFEKDPLFAQVIKARDAKLRKAIKRDENA